IQVLEWAGLIADEGPNSGGAYGPYFQSQRTDIYQKHAQTLVENEVAYYAFDTPEEIEAMRRQEREKGNAYPKYDAAIRLKMRNSLTMQTAEVEAALKSGAPYVIRLLVPEDKSFAVDDIIRGRVFFDSREVDDQVLIKSDGFPTYHLANVVDDHLMQISHIIRGEEWLSSVPKHLLLYEYFNWQPPQMAHLPLIFNPDGTKMSKRDIQSLDELPSGKVDPDVASYIRRGYEKEAIINYIALLGWNPGEGDERQVFSLKELIGEFSLERVNKSAAIFDIKKLNWLNKEHIMRRSADSLVRQFKSEFNDISDDYLVKVVRLLQERLHFTADFNKQSRYFFQDPATYEPEAVKKSWRPETAALLIEFTKQLDNLPNYSAAEIEAALRKFAEQKGIGAGKMIHPIRLAVTGVSVGPGLFEILEVLGKDCVARRLQRASEWIAKMIA
ncbi:glutamate--tRNA ligase, partial [candidate division KSB1 bacterium]|nr:glutamate--tRNA ligase [candidate division KSB1 bacterium]